jgi:NADPH:quinone reductase-like Zn-dependent oxidoreductase
MKAAVYAAYGGPEAVRIVELPIPVPNDDEVLIRVCAAALNPHDWRIMRGSPYVFRKMYGGFRAPTVRPGRDVAGDVEAVGKSVSQFKPGDAIFGFCHGGLAEYACTSQSRLAPKPSNATYEQAASVPVAGMTALQALRDHGNVQAGQSVLINGAAGGVGTFAVQMAKAFGAVVTGVCSPGNVDFVRSLGADHVIDYTISDFTRAAEQYDSIVDCAGNHGMSEYKNVLKTGGMCVIVGAPKEIGTLKLLGYFLEPKLLSRFTDKTFITFITKANERDLPAIAEMIENGLVTPVIDSRFPLRDTAKAIAHLEEGHARGKVIVTTMA